MVLITIDSKDFIVTSNLYIVLSHLRYETKPRMLWIDAICIDQTNMVEKGSQIALMRQIYENAERGVIWLGELGVLEELGVNLIRQLRALSKTQRSPNIEYDGSKWAAEGLPSSLEAPWRGLQSILNSPWFSRKWIIQEVATPKAVTVLIGSQTVDWDDLAISMRFLMESQFSNTKMLIHCQRCVLLGSLRRDCQKGMKFSLLSLLRAFSGNGATDERDHIFALLTVAGDEVLRDVFSYDQSFEELSVAVTRIMAVEYKRLDPLKFVFGKWLEGNGDGLPSWVVDWRPLRGERPAVIRGSNSGWEGGLSSGILNATKGSKYIAQYPELPNQMTVRGKAIDDIVRMSQSFDESAPNSLFELLDWKKIALDAAPNKPFTEAQLYERFCRVIQGGTSINDVDQYITAEDLTKTHNFLENLEERKLRGLPGDSNSVYRQVTFHEVGRKITTFCFERRLVVTSDGNLGVVPRRVIIDDKVCLLMGSDVPYMLRKAYEHLWFVVGHCYVDGVMDGEAFVEGECENMVLV
jgi:hypothetical protein